MKKKSIIGIFVLIPVVLFLWLRAPEQYFVDQISEPEEFPENPDIVRIAETRDLSTFDLRQLATDVPAQDEILLQESMGRAFIASMDGQIWKMDLASGVAQPYVDVTLMPAGMVQHPTDPDRIFFCLSRATPEQEGLQGPGIYELIVSTKEVRTVVTRVPLLRKLESRHFENEAQSGSSVASDIRKGEVNRQETGHLDREASGQPRRKPGEYVAGDASTDSNGEVADLDFRSTLGILFRKSDRPTIPIKSQDPITSQPVVKADDLAISRDGQRIYFTEPYDHPGAILGVTEQSRNEAITLGKNGNVWMVDLQEGTVSLVARDYTYIDGILLEYDDSSSEEVSLIASEISTYRMIRLHLEGKREGEDEVVIDGLPGFPDGIDRDSSGRIWVAFPVMRSGLVNWLHKNPLWKHLVLYIPQSLQPVSRKTALLALSPDGSTPLFFAVHDGSSFASLIVATPGGDRIYLSLYSPEQKGLYTIRNPLE